VRFQNELSQERALWSARLDEEQRLRKEQQGVQDNVLAAVLPCLNQQLDTLSAEHQEERDMLRGQLAEERERFEREIAAQRFVIEDLQLSLTLQRANLRPWSRSESQKR